MTLADYISLYLVLLLFAKSRLIIGMALNLQARFVNSFVTDLSSLN
jgi:hypothetical protein